MEADWELEIGADAPVMDAHWDGLVDLAAHPEQAARLPEVELLPELAGVLVRLNAAGSPVWTAKCDVWAVDLEEEPLDPDELDVPLDGLNAAVACYLDVLPRELERWADLEDAADDCAALRGHLRTVELRGCRVDLVARRAVFAEAAEAEDGLGITAYFTAGGGSDADARSTLAKALDAFADAVPAVWTH